jgi:acyl-CoA synthetase (AMP-forming)/AMP-acid ligase II
MELESRWTAKPKVRVIRGNSVMKGYLKIRARHRKEAFKGGYFHSVSLASTAPDGSSVPTAQRHHHSGGENISVEVENTLMGPSDVMLCAVVAMPADDKWGEAAFVQVKSQPTRPARRALIRVHQTAPRGDLNTLQEGGFRRTLRHHWEEIQKFELHKTFR